MATIKERIADYTGSDMDATLVTSYEDLIKNAFNFIIDLIPSTSELWHHTNIPLDIVVDSTSEFENKRILSVKRLDSVNSIYYPCRETSLKDGLKTSDPNSIFYKDKGARSPIYYVDEQSNLIVLPAPTPTDKVSVYYVDYLVPLGDDISSYTSLSANLVTEGIPDIVMDLGCIRSSILLLQARISNAVQDDEDTELLQLLQGQMASLNSLFQEEVQRLNIPFKKVGVSDDIA